MPTHPHNKEKSYKTSQNEEEKEKRNTNKYIYKHTQRHTHKYTRTHKHTQIKNIYIEMNTDVHFFQTRTITNEHTHTTINT